MTVVTPYIIAEIANAHEGSPLKALQLVESAAKSGCDAVKFQIIVASELVKKKSDSFKLFSRLQLHKNEWLKIFERANEFELDIWCDVYGFESLSFSAGCGLVSGFKIHTSDIRNYPLMREVARYGKPVLLSCGGCTDTEIKTAIDTISACDSKIKITLMHGYQAYPTSIEENCLYNLSRLRHTFMCDVGIMDHNDGSNLSALVVPILANMLGAKVIEKHITLRREDMGIDYFSSLNPDEFKKMVTFIRQIPNILGKFSKTKGLTASELIYAKAVKKKLSCRRDLKLGWVISDEDLCFVRDGQVPYSLDLTEAVGRVLACDKKKEDTITYYDLTFTCQAVKVESHECDIRGIVSKSRYDLVMILHQFLEQTITPKLWKYFKRSNLEYMACVQDNEEVILEIFNKRSFLKYVTFKELPEAALDRTQCLANELNGLVINCLDECIQI